MPYLARTHQLKSSLLYHIFGRGNDRKEIFLDAEDYHYFINLLIDYSKKHSFCVYHWVLMPNHYHLLLEIGLPEKISSIMSGLARSYVYHHHKKYQTSGHLWQGRFKSQPIQKEMYMLSCGRYIERNPVKAGIITLAEDYPYSSAAYYVFGKKDGLTVESPLFADIFGVQKEQRRNKYKEFLRAFNPQEEEWFENLESPQGSEEFIKRLTRDRGLLLPKRRGRVRN